MVGLKLYSTLDSSTAMPSKTCSQCHRHKAITQFARIAGHIQRHRQDYWEDCPRSAMSADYAADPEFAADETYAEWRGARDEGLDDEWDGDEHFDPYEAAGESRFGLPGGGRSL